MIPREEEVAASAALSQASAADNSSELLIFVLVDALKGVTGKVGLPRCMYLCASLVKRRMLSLAYKGRVVFLLHTRWLSLSRT